MDNLDHQSFYLGRSLAGPFAPSRSTLSADKGPLDELLAGSGIPKEAEAVKELDSKRFPFDKLNIRST